MSEIDAMKRLAEANPVRVEGLAPMHFPHLPHRRPQRRWVLAVAVAFAASLIGFFIVDGSPRHPQGSGLTLVPPPTLAHPLVDAKQVSLAEATKAFGAPIVLPDTALVAPSDAGAVWLQSQLPGDPAAAIAFPGPQIIVQYLPNQSPEAPLAQYTAMAKGLSDAQVVDLGGVPALAIAQNSDSTGANFGSIEFVIGGTQIAVLGHYDEETLQAVAQSIVDRSGSSASVLDSPIGLPTVARPLPLPSAKEVSLAEAAATIGHAIVLPATSLVGPADVGPVWADGTRPTPTAAAVTFPSQGVFIDYIPKGPIRDPRAHYRGIAEQDPRSFQTISLNGTALAVKQNSDQTGHNFGGVIFMLGRLEIRVFGHYDEATLQSVAQSIVDRSK